MTWRDAAALVARELRRRAGRSALTVAAVALAGALLTALVTIAGTAQNRVLSDVTTGGPLAGIKVAAAQPDPSPVGQDNARPGPPRPLDGAALRRISRLKNVQAAYPVLSVPIIVLAPEQVAVPGSVPPVGVGPSEPYGDSLVGVPLDQASHLPLTLLAGRLPLPGSRTEVLATPGLLDRLHLGQSQAADVVGAIVELGFPRAFIQGAGHSQWPRPTIVGVAAQDAGPGQFVGSIELAGVGREWALGGGLGRENDAFGLQPTTYTGVFVVADRLDNVASVRNRITDIGFATQAREQLIASVKRYLWVVEIVLAGVGLIALVVAALGIANALYAAVRERRREIGVLKAIGARDRDVRRVFLLEAVLVGLVGGVIGASAGTG